MINNNATKAKVNDDLLVMIMAPLVAPRIFLQITSLLVQSVKQKEEDISTIARLIDTS